MEIKNKQIESILRKRMGSETFQYKLLDNLDSRHQQLFDAAVTNVSVYLQGEDRAELLREIAQAYPEKFQTMMQGNTDAKSRMLDLLQYGYDEKYDEYYPESHIRELDDVYREHVAHNMDVPFGSSQKKTLNVYQPVSEAVQTRVGGYTERGQPHVSMAALQRRENPKEKLAIGLHEGSHAVSKANEQQARHQDYLRQPFDLSTAIIKKYKMGIPHVDPQSDITKEELRRARSNVLERIRGDE